MALRTWSRELHLLAGMGWVDDLLPDDEADASHREWEDPTGDMVVGLMMVSDHLRRNGL